MESDLWSFIRGSAREAASQLVAVANEGNVSTDCSAGMSSEGDCVGQVSLEKELFAAVRHRSAAECGDLLGKLQNVNVMRESGETPLYLAVLLGKSEWTEALLSMGSDPCVADGAGVTALLVAEEMHKAEPSDSERKFILGLVKLASKLRGRKGGGDPEVGCPVSETRSFGDSNGAGGSDGRVTADGGGGGGAGASDVDVSSVGTSGGTSTASREASSQSRVEERLEQLTLMVTELSRKVDSLGIKASSLKEGVETLVDNASIQGTAVSEMRTEVAAIKSQLSTGLLEIRREVAVENGASTLHVRSISESVQKMALDMRNRDDLLRSIESGVTALVDQGQDERSSLGSEEGDDDDCSESESEIDQSECHECSDYLSGIAQYHGDSECLENLTAYFDNLYSQGKLLSSLLRFMRENKNWELLVDFENSDIGARWPDFKDLEGRCIGDSGPKVRSHASRRFVYVSAKLHGVYTEDRLVGWLAIAMARMAMLLAFRNRCKPYGKGDRRSEAKFKEVVTDAEKKLSQLGSARLNWYLKNALEWKTQEAKEIALISAVPGIIAHYGRSEGVRILREQLPPLLNYYRDYVITKFERNTQGS